MRATRAVRGDPELLGLDRPREDDNVSQRRSACACIADIGSVDADAGEQSQERLFLLDARRRTDGLCSPSRSVSSFSTTRSGRSNDTTCGERVFQS
jgi:hypothetical protein